MAQSQKSLQPSSKRGLGWPWNNTAAEFAIYNDALASGKVSWLFNWEMWKPDGTPDGVEYIPQVRVGNQASQIDQFLSAIPRGKLKNFMSFNEPEIPSSQHVSRRSSGALETIRPAGEREIWLSPRLAGREQ